MAEKKETSKRRVLTPEEVEQVTGGALVRPTTAAALVTMDSSGHEKGSGRAFGGGAGGGESYVCNCGYSCKILWEAKEHEKVCNLGWKKRPTMK